MIAVVPDKARLSTFRADPGGAYDRMLGALPDGPDLAGAERVSKLIGKLEMPNKIRLTSLPGLAFIGDAGLAPTPSSGSGAGGRFKAPSGSWTRPGRRSWATGTSRPRWRATAAPSCGVGPHHLQIVDYATGRPLRLNERMTFRAAARTPWSLPRSRRR